MKKLLWTFILSVAAADIYFTWRCCNSVLQWESNPAVVWVFCRAGLIGVVAYRLAWLAFAGG